MDFDKYLKPIINEKSVANAKTGNFTFEVLNELNKISAKALIEKKYGVKVLNMQRVNLRPKVKQYAVRKYRFTSVRSKIIARLDKGQSIPDFMINN